MYNRLGYCTAQNFGGLAALYSKSVRIKWLVDKTLVDWSQICPSFVLYGISKPTKHTYEL